MPRPRLNNYLRTYRRRNALSQGELAYLLGAESGTKICRYERKNREPKLDALLAYELLFGVSLKELFAGRFAKVEEEVRRRARKLAAELGAKPARPSIARKLDLLRTLLPAES